MARNRQLKMGSTAGLRSIHARMRACTLRRKRELEIDLIIEALKPYLTEGNGHLHILEFGAGSCYQAGRLTALGSVTATDPDLRPPYREGKGIVKIVISRINQAPFESEGFDLIYSNHVLEHLTDLDASLSEIRRIAKPGAIFAFAVPTRLWLWLAQPAVIAGNFTRLARSRRKERLRALGKLLSFGGHGEYRSFSDAFRAFGVSNWTRLFEEHGFHALERRRLLVYAPSELLVPPSRALVRLGLCSSMLFVLKSSP